MTMFHQCRMSLQVLMLSDTMTRNGDISANVIHTRNEIISTKIIMIDPNKVKTSMIMTWIFGLKVCYTQKLGIRIFKRQMRTPVGGLPPKIGKINVKIYHRIESIEKREIQMPVIEGILVRVNLYDSKTSSTFQSNGAIFHTHKCYNDSMDI